MLGYEIKQEVSKQLGGHPIDWHGHSAAVVGSQIVLPAMNDDLDYPEDMYRQMLGYGFHELGHLRYIPIMIHGIGQFITTAGSWVDSLTG